MVDETVRKHQAAIKLRSLNREAEVVKYYAGRYKVLTTTDEETRSLFDIRGKVADVVVEVSPHRAIVAETKGTDLDHALEQLQNTVRAPKLRNRFIHIECKIFATPDPSLSSAATMVDLRGGTDGLRAVRVFKRDFPGEWLLYRYRPNRTTEPVEIGNSVVSIIFGPA